ncbi:MAG: hypothetical protein RL068_955, partial [Actinomycetota bacterium]|jgi:AcrR family transcriptional regulator
MSRPPRADFRELLIEEVCKQLLVGDKVHVAEACKSIGISPSLVNHYFRDKGELVREAWLRLVLAFIAEDYELLDRFGKTADWNGVETFIFQVFGPDRNSVRNAHIRGLAAGSLDAELGNQVQQSQLETTKRWFGLLKTYTDNDVLHPKVDLWSLAILFSAVPMGVTAVAGELGEQERLAMTQAWVSMLRAVL